MTKTISVTEFHIERGKRGNSEKCPVGLAMAGQGLNIGYVKMTYETRLLVFGFMEDFDKEVHVEPFTFEVEV
jgi:hypothetical protein